MSKQKTAKNQIYITYQSLSISNTVFTPRQEFFDNAKNVFTSRQEFFYNLAKSSGCFQIFLLIDYLHVSLIEESLYIIYDFVDASRLCTPFQFLLVIFLCSLTTYAGVHCWLASFCTLSAFDCCVYGGR